MKIGKKHLGLSVYNRGTHRGYKVPKWLLEKIGPLDIYPVREWVNKKSWQAMLKGLKPGDKVKVLWVIIR